MKPDDEDLRRRRLYEKMLRAERRRKFGRDFWNLTLQAARVVDEDNPSSNIFCATFFSRHNISIPDQQYRSLRLCHALCEAGIVDRNKTVAIVGAGISGMTCAVALAVRTDCLVHVFESDEVLLRRFWEAPFRYLHPNLNTWAVTSPVNSYRPHTRTRFPVMNWTGDYAPFVAEQLCRQFQHYRHCLGIALRLEELVLDVFERSGKPMVLLDSSSNLPTLREFVRLPGFENEILQTIILQTIREQLASQAIAYDAVIIATGFGQEKRPVGAQQNAPLANDYSYWRSGNPDFYTVAGRTRESRPKRVLIGGNGDSAIIELAHYLIRDFAHDRIFEFLPMTDIGPTLWEHFRGMVGSLRYRPIEAGNPERYGLAGPISWYWTQRASRFSPTRTTEQEAHLTANTVTEYEQRIYARIDSTLGATRIGAKLSGGVINEMEQDVDDDLSALASYEIEAEINSIFGKEYYDPTFVAAKFSADFVVTIVGPTPTIYSRRQSPLTWYLIRMLTEFGGDALTYKQGRVESSEFVDGVIVVKVDTMRDPLRFDAIVSRQGPTYETGLVRQLRPAKSAVSKYALAGNPIPGDDIALSDGSGFFGSENWSKESYLYFLHTYFQTRLWKRVISRGVSLADQHDSDQADLTMVRIHWSGNAKERAEAEKLFRAFKAAEKRRSRNRAQDRLVLLKDHVRKRRTKELYAQDQLPTESRDEKGSGR